MEISKTLVALQKQVNQRLKSYLGQEVRKYKKVSPLIEKMIKESESFILGDGKRVRPIFVYFGYIAAGGRDKKAILAASIFAELIHDYFLVHDDIIDQDELRHGLPSLHARYQNFYKNRKDAKHLGITAGILAGDLIAVFGYDILAQAKFKDIFKIKAILELNRIIAHVIGGQTMDVFLGLGHDLDEKEIFKIQEYKTSRYTVDGPMQIGAILAGANEKVLNQISKYAIPLGVAFQIQDDILGMFGDSKKTGKPSGADLREGKQTLLILKARQLGDEKQKKIISEALGNQNLTDKQLEAARKVIIDTGSLKYSQQLAEKFVNEARRIIEKSKFPAEAKEFLAGIGEYIIKREK